MKFVSLSNLLIAATAGSLLLGPQDALAICEEKYAQDYDATAVPLECAPFEGDPMLHAIVYGCDSINQEMETPAGLVSQTFTQKCDAQITDDTMYTCYELAEDTDYQPFLDQVDTTITCSKGTQLDTPAFLYQNTTGSFEFGGDSGSQQSGGAVDPEFKEELAAGSYYILTVKAGEPLGTNPPSSAASAAGDSTAPVAAGAETAGHNTTDDQGGETETEQPPAEGATQVEAPAGASDSTSSASKTTTMHVREMMCFPLLLIAAYNIM